MEVKSGILCENVFNFPQSIPLFKLYIPPNISKYKNIHFLGVLQKSLHNIIISYFFY